MPSGNPIWTKRFGDDYNQYGHSVASDLFGAPVITGSFGGMIDFGQGTFTAVPLSTNNIFLAKLAP